MNRCPKVSVCIPSYNHEKYVGTAIESVLNQSFQDLELIIVDDASVDESKNIINSYVDKRLIKTFNDNNCGFVRSLDRAIAEARGEYVAILGSDDFLRADKLSTQLKILTERDNVGAVFSYMSYVDEQGEKLDRPDLDALFCRANRPRAEWLRSLFLEGNQLAEPTCLIRRAAMEKIGPHNALLAQTPDFDYWVRFCLKFEIFVVPERLTYYRVHSNQNNISANTPDRQTRLFWESSFILRNFLQIKDREFMQSIFPDSKIKNFERLPVSILLVEAALSSPHKSIQLFGLDHLRDLLGNNDDAEELAKIGYDAQFLSKSIGVLDPFKLT